MSKKDGPRGPVWLLQIGGEIVMMRVAVTYENGNVFQHFGHSEKFKIYDVEDGHIVKADVIDTKGQGHGALVGFLQAQEINAVIAGGIGGGAQQALAAASIDLYGGVTGSADEAVMVNITAVPTAAEVISNLSVPWKGDDSLEEYHRFLYERLPLLQGRQRSLG